MDGATDIVDFEGEQRVNVLEEKAQPMFLPDPLQFVVFHLVQRKKENLPVPLMQIVDQKPFLQRPHAFLLSYMASP